MNQAPRVPATDYEGDIPEALYERVMTSLSIYTGFADRDYSLRELIEVAAPHFIGYGIELADHD